MRGAPVNGSLTVLAALRILADMRAVPSLFRFATRIRRRLRVINMWETLYLARGEVTA